MLINGSLYGALIRWLSVRDQELSTTKRTNYTNSFKERSIASVSGKISLRTSLEIRSFRWLASYFHCSYKRKPGLGRLAAYSLQRA